MCAFEKAIPRVLSAVRVAAEREKPEVEYSRALEGFQNGVCIRVVPLKLQEPVASRPFGAACSYTRSWTPPIRTTDWTGSLVRCAHLRGCLPKRVGGCRERQVLQDFSSLPTGAPPNVDLSLSKESENADLSVPGGMTDSLW